MFDIFKIIAIGLTGGILSMAVGQYKAEYGILTTLATIIILFFGVCHNMEQIWSGIKDITEKSGVNIEYFTAVMKIAGVAYITQFASELLRDSGQGAIGGKIELAGKIFVVLLTMPIIKSFLDVCTGAINLLP